MLGGLYIRDVLTRDSCAGGSEKENFKVDLRSAASLLQQLGGVLSVEPPEQYPVTGVSRTALR